MNINKKYNIFNKRIGCLLYPHDLDLVETDGELDMKKVVAFGNSFSDHRKWREDDEVVKVPIIK